VPSQEDDTILHSHSLKERKNTGKGVSPQDDDNILASHSLKERKNTGKAMSSQEHDTILSSHSLKEWKDIFSTDKIVLPHTKANKYFLVSCCGKWLQLVHEINFFLLLYCLL
jgi:hypothetical protein